MKPILNGNLILCKKVGEIKADNVDNIIITTTDKICIYEIIDMIFIDDNKKKLFKFNIGDKVISCSTGISLDDNEMNVIFQSQHIMCKI